ncbi:sugar phosphate isomerase/epimerase [Blastopirellula sp. JC732]|uniref:Sugar phosphate isomerase/epimerase n=1 Tax=Blastopirellula sediminis TaxID=2894196 RepID=A0A9X1MI73_9BACT|nr:TIM barrel protein [Blastopirellula sediminis]MCC9608176.1 sugar phosphate isomerase/epimerase [Blastopirellula sediminis]MCC9627031.1 sugar phosphate isomerase/epimerase [Blastopirellula sediminis]
MTISRRRFLHASAAALAPLVLSRAVLAAPAATEMKLGLVTYNWGKDWDLATTIKNCAATGFAGVELRSTHKHGVEINLSAKQRQEVRKQFADSPVEFVGPGSACEYHSPDPAVVKKNIEETKAFIKLSHDCGGSGVKVRPNGLPKDVPVEKTIEQIGLSLREVAQYAANYGQEIRLEVHGKDTAALPVIHQIMQIADHPQARVCWNCNPTDMDGEGLEANFQLVADKIATVHIHDLRSKAYPWPKLLELLRGAQFTGWTLLEEGNVPADIVGSMRENQKLWTALATK